MDKTNRESEPRRARFCIALISKVSLTLKNSGSVARDHLALERTFLAYVRTSLGLVTAGVALVQLFMTAKPVNFNGTRFRVMIRALGASTVVLGLIVLAIGVIRYFSIQAALTTGMFPAARLSASAIAIAIAILTSVTLGIIMAGTKV
ncbi:hypothetical protein F5887DRAFT_878525 [Amanita rubescens]|nr:hypothetical protein F5887DRAFT_878525 [Amanita rubescens]